jgi:hypothetical protein
MVSKKRRAKYYTNENYRGIQGNRNVPRKYLNKPDEYIFNEEGILIYKHNNLSIIANPRVAGQPRYWVINFQDIYNQKVSEQFRATVVNKLKYELRLYINSITVITIEDFPIEISICIFDIEMPIDISNKGVMYIKCIEDILVEEGIIPDDSIKYVNCSGRTKFIKVDKEEDIKMEVYISKSDNNNFFTNQ